VIFLNDDVGQKDLGESLARDEAIKEAEARESERKVKVTSDKMLVFSIIGILVLFGLVFGLKFILPDEKIETVEDLHQLNLAGKLDLERGYVFNGYSFINIDNFWYSQVRARERVWDVAFRFGPYDLGNVFIEGDLDSRFLNASEIYMTFDPIGEELQYIALAIGEMDQSLIQAFGVIPVAACYKNETEVCKTRPIVTCEDRDKAVVYYKRNETLRVIADGNCLIIEGNEFDIVKGVDRVLMRMYGIMD
jgi:hypothetical protein